MSAVGVNLAVVAAGMAAGASVQQEVEVGSNSGDVGGRGWVSQDQVVVNEYDVGQLWWGPDQRAQKLHHRGAHPGLQHYRLLPAEEHLLSQSISVNLNVCYQS